MIRRPPRSTQSRSSAASDVYKRQLLACGQGHVGVGRRQHVIHDEKMLATTADGETVDGRDPRLFGRRPCGFVRRLIHLRDAAIYFVLKAHDMLDVEKVRNLAVIEVSEID